MRNLVIVLFLVAFIGCTVAQDKIEESKVPKEYVEAFKKKFPEAQKVQWLKGSSGKDNFNVKFVINKKKCYASYEKNAKLTEATIGISYDELPEAVKNGFKSSTYGNWKVQEVIKKVNDYETLYYITAKDKEKQYLPFNEKGELQKH